MRLGAFVLLVAVLAALVVWRRRRRRPVAVVPAVFLDLLDLWRIFDAPHFGCRRPPAGWIVRAREAARRPWWVVNDGW